MRIPHPCVAALLSLTFAGLAAAEDSAAVDVGQPIAITLEPGSFTLIGPRAHQQLLVTGQYPNNELRDLTAAASFAVTNPAVATIDGSAILPVANGDTQVIAMVGGIAAAVNCAVQSMEQPSPISFKNETLMALTKTGCNMGACHGSPSGKGGFRLSLRAYDAELDIMTLRSEFYGRRTNILEPSHSLLLRKPLMEVAHGGGKRLRKTDPSYKILESWIAEGMKLDPAEAPSLTKIETLPTKRVLARRPISSRSSFWAISAMARSAISPT